MKEAEILTQLQAQVADLKRQVDPVQDHEKMLDDLFSLQQKRSTEIREKGIPVSIGASEKIFPCLKHDADTVFFQPGTAIARGNHIIHNSGILGIVKDVQVTAGRIKCSIWKPSGSVQEHSATKAAKGFTFRPVSVNEPATVQGDTVTTLGNSFPAGAVLKHFDDMLEVIGSYSDNGLTIHKVRVFEAK